MADFVLVHSPVTGPATWRWVAGELTGRGHRVTVPAVPPGATSLGWAAFVGSVAVLARDARRPVVVGHSGAGPLLPLIGNRLRATALVFADADVPPESGSAPLVPDEFLEVLRGLVVGKRLPPWSEWFGPDEMAALIPAQDRRALVRAELPSLPLSYYEDRATVPAGWTDTRCGYVLLSEAYAEQAAKAEALGWPVARLAGRHLDMVTRPEAVADAIVSVAGLAKEGRSTSEAGRVPPPRQEEPPPAGRSGASGPPVQAGQPEPVSRPAGQGGQPEPVSRPRGFRRISRAGRRG